MRTRKAYIAKPGRKALLTGFNAAFFALISLPLVFSPFKADLEKTPENRMLTQWAHVIHADTTWKNVFSRIDDYWNDQHAFRQELGQLHSGLRYKAGIISSPDLYWFAGKNGWLFEHRHEYALSEKTLDSWSAYFNSRGETSGSHGINYIAMFAPQKRSIYPEEFGSNEKGKQFWHDQLSAHLAMASQEHILDIREHLKSQKAFHQLYHRLDIHWNLHGSNYAHVALMNEIFELTNDIAYQARHYDDSWFELQETRENGIARALNLQEYLHEKQPWFSEPSRFCTKLLIAPLNDESALIDLSNDIVTTWDFRTHCPQGKGKALVFRDSFSNLLWVFLSEYFEEVIYISRPQPAFTDGQFSLLIEQHNPDIVIEEIAERYIPRGP